MPIYAFPASAIAVAPPAGGLALLGSVIEMSGDVPVVAGPGSPLPGMSILIAPAVPTIVLLSYNLIYHHAGVAVAAPVDWALEYTIGGPPVEIARFGSAPVLSTVADFPFAGTIPIPVPAGPTTITLLGSIGVPSPIFLKRTAGVPAFMSVLG